MVSYKLILGTLSSLLVLGSCIPYIIDTWRGKTKPHVFSWLIWAILTGTGFAAQLVSHAGPGAWVTGVTALNCLTIFILALFKGEKRITRFDTLCLVAALIALMLWIFTKDPTGSVILITLTDALGFLPSFRKGYFKPFEETTSAFTIGAVAFVLGLFSLETYSLTTWLYPASLILTNSTFVAMLLIRRRQVKT